MISDSGEDAQAAACPLRRVSALDVVEQAPPADRAHRKRGVERDEGQPAGATDWPWRTLVDDGAEVDLDVREEEQQDAEAEPERQQRADIEEALARARAPSGSSASGRDSVRSRPGRCSAMLTVRRPPADRAPARWSTATRPRPSSTPIWMLTLWTNRLSKRLCTQNTTSPPNTSAEHRAPEARRAWSSERTSAPPS